MRSVQCIIVMVVGLLFFVIADSYVYATSYVNDPRSIDMLLGQRDVKTSVDLSDVLSGGVGKDGIPPIDRPEVVPVLEGPDWLNPQGDGIFIERSGKTRFYPYQVLVSHEIVNDTFQGEDILVTYCPLCFTGVVFDPTVDGVAVEFGVSGKLWESNLLMYNRSDPESLWSQALGEAVVGPATGQLLPVVRFDITTYGQYAQAFPDGEVVIGDADAGFLGRSYAHVPYGGDLRDISPIFPFSGKDDDRFEKTEIILGLVVNNQAKAYPVVSLQSAETLIDQLGGERITIQYDNSSGVASFFKGDAADGERLTPIPSFWVSWVSVHPDTEIYPLRSAVSDTGSSDLVEDGEVRDGSLMFGQRLLLYIFVLLFGLAIVLFGVWRYFSRLK